MSFGGKDGCLFLFLFFFLSLGVSERVCLSAITNPMVTFRGVLVLLWSDGCRSRYETCVFEGGTKEKKKKTGWWSTMIIHFLFSFSFLSFLSFCLFVLFGLQCRYASVGTMAPLFDRKNSFFGRLFLVSAISLEECTFHDLSVDPPSCPLAER